MEFQPSLLEEMYPQDALGPPISESLGKYKRRKKTPQTWGRVLEASEEWGN